MDAQSIDLTIEEIQAHVGALVLTNLLLTKRLEALQAATAEAPADELGARRQARATDGGAA